MLLCRPGQHAPSVSMREAEPGGVGVTPALAASAGVSWGKCVTGPRKNVGKSQHVPHLFERQSDGERSAICWITAQMVAIVRSLGLGPGQS